MITVRYTGVTPTLFAGRVGYREPGDVFGLTDEEAEAYTHRSDIETVEDAEPAPPAETPAAPAE